MASKKPTMRDVAKQAGVALGTVDRYLNGNVAVTKKKSDAIRKAIEELQYVPNKAAKVLSLGASVDIGIVYPYVERAFWRQIEKGIERASKEYGASGLQVHPVHIDRYDAELQLQAMNELAAKGMQGIAIVPTHESHLNAAISQLTDQGIHVVTFDSDAPLSRRFRFIGEDNFQGGEIAARIMAMLIHEKGEIAVFRFHSNLYAIQQRIMGFGQKIAGYPDAYVAAEYKFDGSPADNEQRLKQIIQEYFPADDIKGIFCTNNGELVASVLRNAGFGRRYKIVSFDFLDDTREFLQNGDISAVVCTDLEKQGYLAVRSLYERIVNGTIPEQAYRYTRHQVIFKEMLDKG